MKTINNEQDLQKFISTNPWLININYEIVPELYNGGMEYITSNQKRIDLILRDRIIGNPVIVEFKFVPFYRENIGQILEYKTRIVTELNNSENILFGIFGKYLSIPKMVLVVKECDDFTRIACNMNGIEIIEFLNFSETLSNPKNIETIEQFTLHYKDSVLPISFNRGEEIEISIYSKIREILTKYGFDNEWVEPRKSSGFFHPKFNSMFINRWIFFNEPISIGIYEDIVYTKKVVISFFITKKEIYEKALLKFNKLLKENKTLDWDEVNNEGYLDTYFELKDFINDIEMIFDKYLLVFLELRKIHLTTAST